MEKEQYRYDFSPAIPIKEVEESLFLAVLAAECLHGRALIRLDGSFSLDPMQRFLVVDAGTDVGRSIARIFTGFLMREFGEKGFRVERIDQAPPASMQKAGEGA